MISPLPGDDSVIYILIYFCRFYFRWQENIAALNISVLLRVYIPSQKILHNIWWYHF